MIPCYLRYGIAAVLLIAGAWWAYHAIYSRGAASVQTEWDAAQNARKEESAREQERAVVTYRLELGSGADLLPAPTVRLCAPAIVYAEGTAEDGTGEAATAAERVQPVLPGRDVGPDLDTLMRAADAVSARLRAVQGLH